MARSGFLLLLLLGCLGWAADDPDPPPDQLPRISLSASPGTVALGDEVDLVLEARWQRPWVAESLPRPADLFAEAWVASLLPEERWRDGDTEVVRWALSVVAERSGAWELPQPTLLLRHPDGRRQSLQAEPVVVTVDLGEAPEIPAGPGFWRSDAAPPEPVSFPWWIPALAVVALALAVGWWVRRGQAAETLSPAERFALALSGVAAAADGKQAGSLLGLALRGYLGERCGFDGAGATARECRLRIREHLSSDEASRAAGILDRLEALRWGPDDLPTTHIKPLLDAARDWVAASERARAAAEAAARSEAAS